MSEKEDPKLEELIQAICWKLYQDKASPELKEKWT